MSACVICAYDEASNEDHGRLHWFSTYRVHHRVAERFRSGRGFILRDAAHVHSPVGGQGLNTGIGDAINLSWKLAAVARQGRPPHARPYRTRGRLCSSASSWCAPRAPISAKTPRPGANSVPTASAIETSAVMGRTNLRRPVEIIDPIMEIAETRRSLVVQHGRRGAHVHLVRRVRRGRVRELLAELRDELPRERPKLALTTEPRSVSLSSTGTTAPVQGEA
jgi:hypothetical protein